MKIDRSSIEVIDFDARSDELDAHAAFVRMCDDDHLVAQRDKREGELEDVVLNAAKVGVEEVADHAYAMRSSIRHVRLKWGEVGTWEVPTRGLCLPHFGHLEG